MCILDEIWPHWLLKNLYSTNSQYFNLFLHNKSAAEKYFKGLYNSLFFYFFSIFISIDKEKTKRYRPSSFLPWLFSFNFQLTYLTGAKLDAVFIKDGKASQWSNICLQIKRKKKEAKTYTMAVWLDGRLMSLCWVPPIKWPVKGETIHEWLKRLLKCECFYLDWTEKPKLTLNRKCLRNNKTLH